MKKYLFALLIVSSQTQSKVSSPLFELKVVFGDKITKFSYEVRKEKHVLVYHTNPSGKKEKVLSNEDARFLLEKVNAVPSKKEEKLHCRRKFITLSTSMKGKHKESSACLDSKSEVNNKLSSLLSLLGQL